MAELHDLSALEQAAAIRNGELSPVELSDHYLKRTEQLNETVGAYVTVTADLAREQAAEREQQAIEARRTGADLPPLHGVPIPIKDLNFVAGVRCTLGSAVFAEQIGPTDDHVVRKLRDAGTVMPGKTNTPEFGLPCYTENRVAPPARTPWDLERSAGGSSGGAGAAVASGLAPAAQGSDGGGSIRIPASVCGLFGIKPSRGRVSSGPIVDDPSGLSIIGPITRTVADAAALLDAMAGYVPGDPFTAPALQPGETFLSHVGRDPGRLRVGRFATPPVPGVTVHPECLAAYESASSLLAELGHDVEDVELPLGGGEDQAFLHVWAGLASLYPIAPDQDGLLMPLTRHLRQIADGVTAQQFGYGLLTFRALGRFAADLFGGYDVLLSPTLAQPPALVGGLRDEDDPERDFAAQTAFTPFTPLYNIIGWPAVNLPLHWSAEGLPIGVMVAAHYGNEAALLELSAQVEAARPWRDRHPSIW